MEPPNRKAWGDPGEHDIHALLCHYDSLYFDGHLGSCVISWTNSVPPRHTGICHYEEGGYCEIHLSKPLLAHCPCIDLKNTLLHEMIHAYLWIKNCNDNHMDHGKSFQELVNKIQSSSVHDGQRPVGGYNITLYHELARESAYLAGRWTCDTCGDLVEKDIDKEPSSGDCIEKVKHDGSCGNVSCPWHRRKGACSGSYLKLKKTSRRRGNRQDLKGEDKLLEDRLMASTHGTGHKQRSHGTMVARKKSDVNDEASCEESADSTRQKVTRRNLAGQGMDMFDGREPCPARRPGPGGHDDDIDSTRGSPDSQTRKSLRSKELKDTNLKRFWHVIPTKTPPNVDAIFGMKRGRDGEEMKDSYKCQDDYTIISEWSGWYSNEECEKEDTEPLVNKRTERRKRQKLLNNLKEIVMEDQNVKGASSLKTSEVCIIIEDEVPIEIDLHYVKDNDDFNSSTCLKDNMEVNVDLENGRANQDCMSIQVHEEFCDVEMKENKPPLSQGPLSDNASPSNHAGGCNYVVSQPCSSQGDTPPLDSPDRQYCGDI